MSNSPYLREIEEIEDEIIEQVYEDTIEGNLIRLGYTPISKIVINNNGETYVRYFKVLNAHGQKVYVDLDMEGSLVIDDQDEILSIAPDIGREIPLIEDYQCLEGEVCGVLSQCDGNICTLTRPIESVYPKQTLYSRPSSKKLVVDDIAFPVIRLSSILRQPKIALQSQYDTNEKLRNEKNLIEVQKLNDIGRLLNLAVSEFNEYRQERDNIAKQVYESIDVLEKQNKVFIENQGVVTLQDQSQRNDIVLQLKNRNEIVIDILKCSETITKTKEALEYITKTFDEAKRQCLKNANT